MVKMDSMTAYMAMQAQLLAESSQTSCERITAKNRKTRKSSSGAKKVRFDLPTSSQNVKISEKQTAQHGKETNKGHSAQRSRSSFRTSMHRKWETFSGTIERIGCLFKMRTREKKQPANNYEVNRGPDFLHTPTLSYGKVTCYGQNDLHVNRPQMSCRVATESNYDEANDNARYILPIQLELSFVPILPQSLEQIRGEPGFAKQSQLPGNLQSSQPLPGYVQKVNIRAELDVSIPDEARNLRRISVSADASDFAAQRRRAQNESNRSALIRSDPGILIRACNINVEPYHPGMSFMKERTVLKDRHNQATIAKAAPVANSTRKVDQRAPAPAPSEKVVPTIVSSLRKHPQPAHRAQTNRHADNIDMATSRDLDDGADQRSKKFDCDKKRAFFDQHVQLQKQEHCAREQRKLDLIRSKSQMAHATPRAQFVCS